MKRKRKAKTKYEMLVEPNLFLIECWARDGVIESEIAQRLGIAYSTLRIYKGKFSALSAALKKGKEVADYEVETSLFQKTKGYNVTVKKAFKLRNIKYNDSGKKIEEKEEIAYADEEIHIPADTTAQIFWLKNRRPDKWRSQPISEENNAEDTGVIVLPEVAEVSENE